MFVLEVSCCYVWVIAYEIADIFRIECLELSL